MYGSIVEADAYLDDARWSALPSATKTKHLNRAAELIDALNYYDQKLLSTQEHEFPRTNETSVPTDIEQAAYYIALSLSDGYDEELEARSNTHVSVGRANRGRPRKALHILAGIPSVRAWKLLYKYLRTPSISVERI